MQGYLTFGGGEDGVHLVQLPQQRFTFGSDEKMDLAVTVAGLPGYCGSFTWDHERGSWALETDAAARSVMKLNGMPLMQPAVMLEDGSLVSAAAFTLRFDLLPQVPAVGGQEMRVITLTGTQVRIGRGNEEADPTKIVLDAEDGDVSRNHATLEYEAAEQSWYLRDHSHAGTELNGQAFERERLVIGDRFRIGHYVFEFTGRSLRRLPTSSAGRIVGRALTRVVGNGKRILNEVSMDVPPGSFVGLLGGSGQGKSTLMTAMCGLNPPTSGEILLNGVKIGPGSKGDTGGVGRIGFVPQDDIVHTELTVREAITFSACLRLPDDPADAEIEALVMATARRLSLEPHLHKRVFQLSGGQRKRVSIATEMLMKPSVLFLDEPSSGLDPATEFYLMETLRLLAGADCTVICTTHVLGFAHLFDRVSIVQGGRVVFYGRPDDAPKFFDRNEWVDIYLLLDKSGQEGQKDALQWEQSYQASPFKPEPEPSIPLVHDQGSAPPAGRPGLWRTISTLMSRQWSILKADWMNLAFLMAQALAIAVLVGWVAESAGLRSFLSVVAVLWFGCSNAAQQIVGEAPIFRRERVCGLGLNVYLGSKLIFIFMVTGLQCVLLFASVTLTGNLFHPVEFLREDLLADERFGGGMDDNAMDPASTPGHGQNLLENAFGFEEKEAEGLAARFPSSEQPTADGVSHLDEAAIERTAQVVGKQLIAAAIPFKSPEGRAYLKEHLLPSITPPPPSKPVKPGKFRNECMLALVKTFGLQENVLDSKSHALKDMHGEPLRDPVTRKLRKLAPVSLSRVVFIPIVLRFGALLGAGLVGVAMGLAISSVVSSSTQAAMVVPLILIPQILFGGYVVTRPEMSAATRMVSQFIPSSAAQRITEVASIFGQSVPVVTNRTKAPVFIKGGVETVKWVEDGKEQSEDYEKLAVHNTAFQNLIVNPALIGQRKKEMESAGDERREKDNVKSRRDIEPYTQGISCTDLAPARNAALMLLGWLAACYAVSLIYLNRKQPL